jgi:dihydropteroate synthase
MKSGPLELGDRTLVMGILNVTPNSFSDAGQFFDFRSAVNHALDLAVSGADVLDIGGESTRPFSETVALDEELDRVIPVIEEVRKSSDIPISIDTTKAEVARAALSAGADIINDISALRFDPEMVRVAAEYRAPLIMMHMQGNPGTMQEKPTYSSLFSEIISFLEERIQFAVQNGVEREQVIIDPGIGFGKTIAHNLRIIRDLELFHCLDRPILFGASRKGFIGSILDRAQDDREVGTAIVNTAAITAGAHIIRVHDVAVQRQAVLLGDALRNQL